MACSEPGSTATRLAAAGSQSSICPPQPARASVPSGLNRISRVKLRPRLEARHEGLGEGRRLSMS